MNRMQSAATLEELAAIIRDMLPKVGWEDVAGMIPTKYCDARSMPDNVAGLMAWDESGVVRCGQWADHEIATFTPRKVSAVG